jgi:phosphoglycolate phosphatase
MSAVAFDFDGCLADSRGAILPSLRVALVELGFPSLPDEDLLFLIGPPLETGLAELLRRLGADVALAPQLVRAYRRDYQRHMKERTQLFLGIDAAARALAASRGACVVTSKPAPIAGPLVDHLVLGDVFAFVEGPGGRRPRGPRPIAGRAAPRQP